MKVGDLVRLDTKEYPAEGIGVVVSEQFLSCNGEYSLVEVMFPHGIFDTDCDSLEVISESR